VTSAAPYQPRRFRMRWLLLVAAGLFTAGLFFGLGPGKTRTALADNIQSFGHLGFFALVALVAALASANLRPPLFRYPVVQYACGLITSVVAGGLLEFAQGFIPSRNPSWNDLAFDSLGAIVGISLLIAVDWLRSPSYVGRAIGGLASVVMLGTLAFGAWPLINCARAYWDRHETYPLLLKFDPNWIHRFLWHDDCVEVRPGELPTDWPPHAARVAAVVVIHPEQPFPGMGVVEPYPDWRDRQTLAVDLYNPADAPLELGVRIHDFQHNDDYYDRFNRVVAVQPGFQTVRIPIADIEQGPRSRRLDLAHVAGVKLFLIRPTKSVRFYAGNFRLE
jgi:VanZ family protein